MSRLHRLPVRHPAPLTAAVLMVPVTLRRTRSSASTFTPATRPLSSFRVFYQSTLLATVRPLTTSFASTHDFRSYDPSIDDSAHPSDAPTPAASTARASNEDDEGSRDGRQSSSSPSSTAATASPDAASAPAAMSHPYSARAYRARLQHGNFASLRELTRAAYAPSPLTVLVDLLHRSVAPPHRSSPCSPPLTPSLSSVRVRHALGRALDVQWVLSATVAEARDIVLAAETVGDAASHAALQELLAQVAVFANALEVCVRGAAASAAAPQLETVVHVALPLYPGEEAETAQDAHLPHALSGAPPTDAAADAASALWVLPPATHATLLRGVLQLAAVTGSQLHALAALEELITLHESQQRVAARHPLRSGRSDALEGVDGGDDDTFSMDDALALVDAAAQRHVEPLTARDHLYAMQACASEHHRDFHTALSLYRRFVQHVTAGRFAATSADFSDALVALAHSSRTTTHFTELRGLLLESEAAATVPVSVPLYTALIDAASRAVEEPQRMAIALSLYRRLRDGALRPTADTYAALIACCASTREPTHAFAFYHEARQVCGVASFPPRVYTNLLLSYAAAGYGADARATLDVLVEAGAPLSRASFHAALASAMTVREAQEMVELMTERYHIAPTPHTYAYVVQAMARAPAGVTTALQLFDVHEDALRALARTSANAVGARRSAAHVSGSHSSGVHDAGDGDGVSTAMSTSADGVALEPLLLQHYPLYVRALEHALMRLRVDPTQDPRLRAYLSPLVRVAQQRMNAFTGMPPQVPIRVPDRERLCIAVLAADALANLDDWVMPFMSHYSVLVIPYSAVVSLQHGSGRRVEGAMAKGLAAGLHDAVWQETAGGSEHDAIVEHRRRRLAKFLADNRDVVHLVSLEEELRWSRETRRYGVGITDTFARAAAVALHLARRADGSVRSAADSDSSSDNNHSNERSSVYARHESASIVLVSSNYAQCGKYVVALKQAVQVEGDGGGGSAGLRAALRRVSYHNPRTNPNWVPPTLSITRQQQQRQSDGAKGQKEDASGTAAEDVAFTREATVSSNAHAVRGATAAGAAGSAVDADAASALYRRLLHPTDNESHLRVEGTDVRQQESISETGEEFRKAKVANVLATPSVEAAATREEDKLDAELLMLFMSES